MDLPAAWDAGAWSLAVSVVGVSLAAWALWRARSARQAAARAAEVSAEQGLLASISRLGVIAERLRSAAATGDSQRAQDALIEGRMQISTVLGVLSSLPPRSGREELDLSLRETLNAVREQARVAAVALEEEARSVAEATKLARASMIETLGSLEERATSLRLDQAKEGGR